MLSTEDGQYQTIESVNLIEANDIAAGKKYSKSASTDVVDIIKSIIDIDGRSTSKSTSINSQKSKQKQNSKLHISEKPWTFSNWYQHIHWLNLFVVVLLPLYGMLATLLIPPQAKTVILGITLYILSGISITAGYHRLFAHKSYNACQGVKIFFAIFGAGAVEGSIKWWGYGHRVHHRYTDTNRDPYDARQGFWFSHFGWIVLKPNPKFNAKTDITDFNSDWIIRFQHRHYPLIMIFVAYGFPTLVAGLFWGDYWGGFVYGGILKTFVIQQATFCVNSLAHWIGVQPFDDRRTPRDHFVTALVTFGEGYHNFHHEFPSDYRNALIWYQYDPTKHVIFILSKLGLAWNLKTFSQVAIEQSIKQRQSKINNTQMKTNWGVPLQELPVWDNSLFVKISKSQPNLVVISGIVHDVKSFIGEHPGGAKLIKASMGKDATVAFNGGVYAHSNSAHNMLATLRVAVLRNSNAKANTFDIQQEYLENGKHK